MDQNISMTRDRYLSASESALIKALEKTVDDNVRGLGSDMDQQDRVLLNLAARLCERVAYGKAGFWSASGVADLVLISAQLERKALRGADLE